MGFGAAAAGDISPPSNGGADAPFSTISDISLSLSLSLSLFVGNGMIYVYSEGSEGTLVIFEENQRGLN